MKARTWEGTGVNPVWGPDVGVVGVIEDRKVLQARRCPLAIVRPDTAEVDPDHNDQPDLIRRTFTVRIYASVAGDAIGENVYLGANPVEVDTGRAAEDVYDHHGGRGLGEYEDELAATLETLGAHSGINLRMRRLGGTGVTDVKSDGYVAYTEHTFTLDLGRAREYTPGRSLTGVKSGANSVLAWKNPSSRFDWRRMILRRGTNSADPAPTTITGGNSVPITGGDFGVAATEIPGSGTWNYALFSVYDDLNDPPTVGNPDAFDRRSSASVTVQVVV